MNDIRPEANLILDLLGRELDHEIQLNAATGYQLHPEWPAPEVFERPDWDVRLLPPGAREVAVKQIGDDAPRVSQWTAAGQQSEQAAIPQRTWVRPAVTKDVSYPVGKRPRQWGLRFHVGSRTFFLFQPGG